MYLNRGALVLPVEGIEDVDVDLGAIEGSILRIQLPLLASRLLLTQCSRYTFQSSSFLEPTVWDAASTAGQPPPAHAVSLLHVSILRFLKTMCGL